MRLRNYQLAASEGVKKAWQEHQSTLIVQPTGTGKTVTFSHVIKERPTGKAMVLAHREELIFQARDKIRRIVGGEVGVEMAEMRADPGRFFGADVIVSTIQTQCAGNGGNGRMMRFDPMDFSVLVIDEAHHSTSPSWRKVIDYYRQNPNLRVLGVTATPDRADEQALGQVFQSVAFDYELTDAIHDGWLVPIRQRSVIVGALDYSSIRTTAGDLNGGDLARVLEYEEALHGIAAPTMELTAGRKSLVFAASVAHAERLAEIFNRHAPGCARWVCGTTPRDERRAMFADFAEKKFAMLVNVGVATEGFDDPSIECVVMARPTKSRSLYAQMAGRGTRPLAGLVDPIEDAEGRRAAIAASAKPAVEIIDFVGNAGRHRLVTTADILGGNYADDVVERAAIKAREAGGAPVEMDAALELAQRELAEEREQARRAALRVRANYQVQSIDPFDVFQVEPQRERGWDVGKPISEKMVAFLDKHGIKTDRLTYAQAKQLIGQVIARREQKLCSFKQAKILRRNGYETNGVTFTEASKTIDALAKNGWKRPAESQQQTVEIF